MPSDLDTLKRLSGLSLIYPSLLELDDHLPCFAISLSEIPELAAAVAPPDLRECNP